MRKLLMAGLAATVMVLAVLAGVLTSTSHSTTPQRTSVSVASDPMGPMGDPAHGIPVHGDPAHGTPVHGDPATGTPVHGDPQ